MKGETLKSNNKAPPAKGEGATAPESDDENADKNHGKSSSSLLFVLSVPGIMFAIGVAFQLQCHGKSTSSSTLPPRKLISPEPGSWTDGYYTTQPVSLTPSTHALLYPNGGSGIPELVAFSDDDEFLSLGRLYNDLGQIVQSPTHFVNGSALYRGPSKLGTHFVWPSVRVGYRRAIPGLSGGTGEQIELESLTDDGDRDGRGNRSRHASPRLFYVHNFLSSAEADELIRFSTSPSNPYRMAPSTGGTHKAWDQGGSTAVLPTRTSMNAFDVTTKTSADIKRRAFRLLRMGAYRENMADGIQILRYEVGQAYIR